MDVLVCAAQVPFTWGGAELATQNLVAELEKAGHRAEIVRLPTAWDKERLLDAPTAWRLVPTDADLVIAVNFPSYFVRHPRKVVWLFHQHRGAYDCVDEPWSDFGLDDLSLETQQVLSDWDTRALEEATKLFAISRLAADRLEKYNGLRATPLYHPPPLHDRLHPGEFGDHVFCPTRLEQNKRPGLIVRALAETESGVRAVISGRGTLATELQQMKADLHLDQQLELPGFLTDEDLIDYYARALAVIYVPRDEDYGYVTLQAFFAGKPVITSADSGGVLEWVEDGVNGFVTDGTPKSIAAAMDTLAEDRELARKMGEAGRERVRDLTWAPVIEQLLRP